MNSQTFYYDQNFFEESSESDYVYQEKNSLKEVATYGIIGKKDEKNKRYTYSKENINDSNNSTDSETTTTLRKVAMVLKQELEKRKVKEKKEKTKKVKNNKKRHIEKNSKFKKYLKDIKEDYLTCDLNKETNEESSPLINESIYKRSEEISERSGVCLKLSLFIAFSVAFASLLVYLVCKKWFGC